MASWRSAGAAVNPWRRSCCYTNATQPDSARKIEHLQPVEIRTISSLSFHSARGKLRPQPVVGGAGTLAGPVLGCLILVPISEALRSFGSLRIVFYSIILVLFILFWSEGLLNYFRRKYEEYEHWVKV